MLAKELKELLRSIPDNMQIVIAKDNNPLQVAPIDQVEKQIIVSSDWFVDEEEICLVIKTKI